MTPTFGIEHAFGGFPILSLVIFLPLAGALVCLVLRRDLGTADVGMVSVDDIQIAMLPQEVPRFRRIVVLGNDHLEVAPGLAPHGIEDQPQRLKILVERDDEADFHRVRAYGRYFCSVAPP